MGVGRAGLPTLASLGGEGPAHRRGPPAATRGLRRRSGSLHRSLLEEAGEPVGKVNTAALWLDRALAVIGVHTAAQSRDSKPPTQILRVGGRGTARIGSYPTADPKGLGKPVLKVNLHQLRLLLGRIVFVERIVRLIGS